MNNLNKKPLVIITGPTGVGKTDISIDIAKKINGEIISADSIQVYKYMDIGSAKITKEEMDGVKHYLVDELNPDEEFNVYMFKTMAKKAMEEIYAKGKVPIIVGGTGFYIQSILYDIEFSDEEEKDDSIRKKYEQLAKEKGNSYVHNLLEEEDKESADSIHENNLKRVIRALEYFEVNHEKISVHNAREASKESPYNFVYFVLNRQRDVLYERIDKRVDIMIEQGLVNEVKNLLALGYSPDLVSMQGLGYKEIVAYLNGEYTLDETVEIIKRDTRRFAKRQLTWFRREKEVTFMNYEEYGNNKELVGNAMIDIMHKKGIIDDN